MLILLKRLKIRAKKTKKPVQKPKEKPVQKPLAGAPAFRLPVLATPVPVMEQRRMNIVETVIAAPAKKTIRRSALEIKKAEEEEEKKRQAQEKEWEIPAFLRRVKFNK